MNRVMCCNRRKGKDNIQTKQRTEKYYVLRPITAYQRIIQRTIEYEEKKTVKTAEVEEVFERVKANKKIWGDLGNDPELEKKIKEFIKTSFDGRKR